MLRNSSPFWFALLIWSFLAINLCTSSNVISALKFSKDVSSSDHDRRFHFATKEERGTIAETEDGVISSVRISDGFNGTYHLQFITLEPNSLFLPVLLHADMVFYVHSGGGSMRWIDEENKKNHIDVEKGDIYRFPSGSVFYMRSNLESTREKLRVYSIFTDSNIENPQSLYIGAYSTINDLVRGFENKVLQTAFNVPEEVLDEITKASKPPAIVHLTTTTKDKHSEDELDWRSGIIESLVKRGSNSSSSSSGDDYSNGKKKKKTKTVNLFKRKPDFSNCNGWSVALTNKDVSALKDSDMGIFMVNLTKGSMMGPHWNPRASEIAIVTHGQGMITVFCPSNANESGCKNMRFKVKEGDVFTVPRFHPMAQMAYNNDSLVFMGFNTNARQNHPQFLAGKSSVFRTLNKDILAMSFNVPNTRMEQLLGSQVESIILECVSCAEEEEDRMREEEQRERREEEARERKKEEAKRREEEEKARERQEEEERKREEEETRRRREEARREEEEAKRREEERQAEEARRKEEQQRKQEEEAKRRQEEARREEEEAKREEEKRQERERKQREEQERQEKEAQQQEEEAQRRREAEEAQRRQQEEEARRAEKARRRQEEEARREETAARRRQKEEARRAEEEEAQRQERQEEAESRRKEEERQQREREIEEAKRTKEERQQREREIEEAKRAEEERQQRERGREEARQERQQTEREEEEARRAEVARQQKEIEMEEAKRAEQERQRREREREEARQEEEERRGGGGEETRRVLREREEARQEEEERRGGGGEETRRVLNPRI
ncbi:vicilin-like seed storage protein At2g18540 [Papaver somniferum]|uniref:vicilin-like seed storage protein At2g18540 n=1 Tax=Papaver somniferum TaxID=3469 RepID=UPI000E705243|nr:vicilin-like seed storage protein At2g18540 [Papaver somniferum]